MADTAASAETPASALSTADGFAIVQSAADKYATFQLVLDLVLANLIDDDPALTPDSDDLAPSKSAVVAYVGDYVAAQQFPVVTTIGGASHNITNTEAGQYLRFTSGSAKTVTFRDNATHALDANVEYEIRCVGADLTILAGTTDVVINEPSGGTLVLSDGMSALVKRVATDEFDVIGQTVPV